MKSLYANLNTWRPYALSVLRIVVALLFLQHGLSKFFGFPAEGPPLSGLIILAAIIEAVGSLLLLVGLFTRLAAFVMSGEMAFAYFMAHASGGERGLFGCSLLLRVPLSRLRGRRPVEHRPRLAEARLAMVTLANADR